MTNVALSTLELFAGVAMLGEGARAASEYLGVQRRTVCYVEREAAAAGQLVALMETGALDSAPVWSDVRTFDAASWRGKVDCIVAGFPCQDLSIAGRRAGLDGKRSGLFFDILDIADACGAWRLELENVSAIATATATIVDETEGELLERAAARVVGELADRGWDSEWITISASDVGANHGRARWFCLAWRMADPRCSDARRGEHLAGTSWQPAEYLAGGEAVADATRDGLSGQHGEAGRGRGVCEAGNPVAHAERAERRPERISGIGCIQGDDRGRREEDGWPGVADAALGNSASAGLPQPGQPGQPELPAQTGRGLHDRPELAGSELERGPCRGVGQADASGDRWDEGRPEPGGEQGRPDAAQRRSPVSAGVGLANTGESGLSDAELGEPAGPGRGIEGGAAAQFRGAPLFAPGPADPIWGGLLSAGRFGAWSRAVTDDEAGSCPWAPATKPGVRMLAYGLALVVDESRAHQLRQVGNGVVPLQAAVAFVVLARRAGLT